MKQILLIIACIFSFQFTSAQEPEKLSKSQAKFEYCEIISNSSYSPSGNIKINFGQQYSFEKELKNIKNKNGKPIKFKNSVDALNFMSSLGWELVDTYSVIDSDDYKLFYYVLKRELTEEEKLEDN